MFLHKVFGYRGVILFPWLARVYDRDMPTKTPSTRDRLMDTENPTFSTPIGGGVGKEVKGRTHTYYQVLIDGRDTPYITHRAQTESVTFLGNHSENTRNLYAIPGLDYVAHEDILPYTTAETNPLQHELFDKFLMYQEGKDPPFVAQDTLRAWQEKNHPWLELSDVHKETTENIRVTVIPFYMGFRQGFEDTMMYMWLNMFFSGRTSRTMCSGGGTASGWRTWGRPLCSSERETGGFSPCQELWRLFVVVVWLVRSQCCPGTSQPSSTALMCLCRLLVVTCG